MNGRILQRVPMRNGLLAALLIIVLIYGSMLGQVPVGSSTHLREFGWSLRPDIKLAKKKASKKSERPSPGPVEPESDVIRIETDLVINDILIVDKEGNPVKGLTKQDLTVSENGKSQEIAVFSHNDGQAIPRSIVLVIDHSFSQRPYIESSIEAAKTLVDMMYVTDRMAIVTDDVELIVDLTSDKSLLKQRLDSLKTDTQQGQIGKSEQYSALYAVLNEMTNQTGTRSVVIFQTDGDQLNTLKPDRHSSKSASASSKNFSYENIIDAAERAGVTIYSVFSGSSFLGIPKREELVKARSVWAAESRAAGGLGGVPRGSGEPTTSFLRLLVRARQFDQEAVKQIALRTGGIAETLESPDDASKIYERILSDVNRRYVIGYYPTDETFDGKRREVEIKVLGHSEYSISGRKFYIARPKQ